MYSWKSHRNWSCEAFEIRVWRVQASVKQWKAVLRVQIARSSECSTNPQQASYFLSGVRNSYFFMSVCAIQDHILGFDFTFCSILCFVLPAASVMDQISYGLSMFNHKIFKTVKVSMVSKNKETVEFNLTVTSNEILRRFLAVLRRSFHEQWNWWKKGFFLLDDLPYTAQKYKLFSSTSHTPYVKDTTACRSSLCTTDYWKYTSSQQGKLPEVTTSIFLFSLLKH